MAEIEIVKMSYGDVERDEEGDITLSIMILNIRILSIEAVSITKLSITTLSITKLRILIHSMTVKL